MDELLFRNPIQVGMVVSNLDQTLEKFQSLLGIGPFRMVEYPPAGIWSDFLREHGPGLHHLKFSMDRLEPARRQLEEHGFHCVQQGAAVGPNKGKVWAYYELQKDLPLCIEIMNEVIEP